MNNIKHSWKEARKDIVTPVKAAEDLIADARRKKRSILYFQYGNIVILTATLALLSYFFFRVISLNTFLSLIGIALMLSGLAIRIIIEIYSILKSKQIVLDKDVSRTTHDAVSYYNFRKKVHGPFTLTTIALYVLGFYSLTPEFRLYISLNWMILMHVSFLVGALFLIWQIRKGIMEEMRNLTSLIELQNELNT